MRIVVDFQGAQTDSRYRGIGRYSTEFVKALAGTVSADDEIILALNGAFADTIENIRADFDGVLSQENIRVWYAPRPIEQFGDSPGNLREVAEIIREFFLRSLDPDLILITSLFEGLGDNAVVSVKKYVRDVPVAAIFYDFTPLYMPDEQFQTNPVYRRWYRERIESLRQCDMLFAISESSRQEAIDQVGFNPADVLNVFGGRNAEFERRTYSADERHDALRRFGITKPFILYAGGVEENKNLKRLVEALSYLPREVKAAYEFVCVGKRNAGEPEKIASFARDPESLRMIKIVGFVDQSELVDLYNLCDLFVFPSLREGLGLPPLEAMACGAPTIVSDRTSLPEVVDNPDALFDPLSPRSIADKIARVLTNSNVRESLVQAGLRRASGLTWAATGAAAERAMRSRLESRRARNTRPTVISHTGLFKPNRKRIIVQKLDHHGDFLLGLPAMAKLRARYPDARIDLLAGSWNRAAAEACGLFDHIHALDYFKARSSLRAELDDEEFNDLLARLPFYDYAIDLRRQSDTRFILVRLSASRYFGYRTGQDRIDCLLTKPLDIHPDHGGERGYFDETHTCEQMLRIVDALPFDANDYLHLPKLGAPAAVRPGSVAIFPRVGNDARQWDSEYFGALINGLAAHESVKEINLFCGRAEELEVIPFGKSHKIKIQAGLPFSDLYTALSANLVCVGNNSFGVHLAGYAGCRTVGIYSGHELPQQWGPPFGESLAIHVDAPCAPCHLPDRPSCPYGVFCLEDIGVETVMTTVLTAMKGEQVPEHYSKISAHNPATALKPLFDSINKAKFHGRIEELTEDQREELIAAVAVDFPERVGGQRRIYVDVSGLLQSESNPFAASGRRIREVEDVISSAARGGTATVLPIAARPSDEDFYFVEMDQLDQSLNGERRRERSVRPVAGDVYIGMHPHEDRSAALWSVLSFWRQNGVFTILAAPDNVEAVMARRGRHEEDTDPAELYLFHAAHFDALVAPGEHCSALERWVADHGPKRLRKLECYSDLTDALASRGRTTLRQRRGDERKGPLHARSLLQNSISTGPEQGRRAPANHG